MAKLTLDEWIARLKKNKSFNAGAAAVVVAVVARAQGK